MQWFSIHTSQVLIPTHDHPRLLGVQKHNPTILSESQQCVRLLDAQKHKLSHAQSKVSQVRIQQRFSHCIVAMASIITTV
jgi:hypothetical protein